MLKINKDQSFSDNCSTLITPLATQLSMMSLTEEKEYDRTSFKINPENETQPIPIVFGAKVSSSKFENLEEGEIDEK
jgi:hypothetical protein